MVQTPTHVSLLQRLFTYFELAASVGMVLPEAHVSAISTVIETSLQELQAIINPPKAAPIPVGTSGSEATMQMVPTQPNTVQVQSQPPNALPPGVVMNSTSPAGS
jgi:hypothetical protein